MVSVNVKKLLLCTLLVLTMIPALLSTMPNFRAGAINEGGKGNDPNHPGENDGHGHQVTKQLQEGNSTTTSSTGY